MATFTLNYNPPANIEALLDYMVTGIAPRVPGGEIGAIKAFHKEDGHNPMNKWIPSGVSAEDFQKAQLARASWIWKSADEAGRSVRRSRYRGQDDGQGPVSAEELAELQSVVKSVLQAAKDAAIPEETVAMHLPWWCLDHVPMLASALVFAGADPHSTTGERLGQKLMLLRNRAQRCGLTTHRRLRPALNEALAAFHAPDLTVPIGETFPDKDVRAKIERRSGGISRDPGDVAARAAVAKMYASLLDGMVETPQLENNGPLGDVVGALTACILVLMPWAHEDPAIWIAHTQAIAASILAAPKTYLAATKSAGVRVQGYKANVMAGILDMATANAPVGARLPTWAELLTAAGLLGVCLGSTWWRSPTIHEKIADVTYHLISAAGARRDARIDPLTDDLLTITEILYPWAWCGFSNQLTDVVAAYAEAR
jgi:hypothetical protein